MNHPSAPAGSHGSSAADENEMPGTAAGRHPRGGDQQMVLRFNERLASARARADRSSEGLALLALGMVYNRLGDERRAAGCLEQAVAAAQELGERRREGRALIHLGSTHNRLGNARGALKCYAQGLAIVRALGDRHDEGAVLNYLGDVYVSLGDTHRAWECYTQSRDILRALGARRDEAIVCWSMGEMLAGQREYARAAALMQILVGYERENGLPDVDHHAVVLEQVRARRADAPALMRAFRDSEY
jgi:tetratricopeptide (TPR) repeat protein